MVWEQGGIPNDPGLFDHFAAYDARSPNPPTGGVVTPTEGQLETEAPGIGVPEVVEAGGY